MHGTIIGVSRNHRPIICFQQVNPGAQLRVLILAGQHGDERPAQRTVRPILDLAPAELALRLPAIRLAVVPEANPDGWATQTRCNADGVDLNRDHELLFSRETEAVHRFVQEWHPHVILDLHSYRPRRRHLLSRNVVLDHDVFVDVPSHPAILARPGNGASMEILRRLLAAVVARDVRADRYALVLDSGRVRHSTLDVVDARNGLTLRFGAFTILIENRQPRRDESTVDRLRLRGAQERALWATLEWLDGNPGLFTCPDSPVPKSQIPLSFNYADGRNGFSLAARDAKKGRPVCVTFSRYSSSLRVRRSVTLPAGYAVPRTHVSLIDLLHRHGFASVECGPDKAWLVERLRIGWAGSLRGLGQASRKVMVLPNRTKLELDAYEVFPTSQPGGDALAVFLEPESKHGLHRFPAMGIPLNASSWYPVLRVCDDEIASLERTGPMYGLERTASSPSH
jgi:hypothetical protein